MDTFIIYLVLIAVAALLIFTVGRMLILWFFRIDKHISNQERIIYLLEKQIDNQTRHKTGIDESK